jgi:Asp-tRNA(Asn)/Glu-tRNA(Gln) amidotransferase A subunit family amidase
VRAGFVPEVTASVLERLDAAGAVDLGRLNMVEFALGLTGHNDITGHPRNPWNREHITGGSSSGPVAAIAARLTFAALGSDTGGSIRVPAACTGITGIKPTYGRVSRAGCLPLSQSLDHIGPLARTARDLALLMEVIAGPDARDPTTAHHPVPSYAKLLDRPLGGLRLALAEAPFEVPLEAEVAGLHEAALERLADLDVRTSRLVLPPIESLNALRRVIMLAEVSARHEDFLEEHRAEYNAYTLARLDPGFDLAATTYLRGPRLQGPRRSAASAPRSSPRPTSCVLTAMASPVPRIDAAGSADTAALCGWSTGSGTSSAPSTIWAAGLTCRSARTPTACPWRSSSSARPSPRPAAPPRPPHGGEGRFRLGPPPRSRTDEPDAESEQAIVLLAEFHDRARPMDAVPGACRRACADRARERARLPPVRHRQEDDSMS